MRRLLAAALLALPYPAIPQNRAEPYLCILVVTYPLNKTQRPVQIQRPDSACDDDSVDLALKRALVILEADRKR